MSEIKPDYVIDRQTGNIKYEIFDISDGDRKSFSLLGPEGVPDDELDWPTDDECSEAIGIRVYTSDAGDHPTRSESILHAEKEKMNEKELIAKINEKELVATIASQDPEDNGQRLDIVVAKYAGDEEGYQFEIIVSGVNVRSHESYEFSDGLCSTRQDALDFIESSYSGGEFDLQWEL